jgi:hypothetical protein
VVRDGEMPKYPKNNGCEQCADEISELTAFLARSDETARDALLAESVTLQDLKAENEALKAEIAKLKGNVSPYDVPILIFTRVEDGADYGDAANIAEMAIRIALRDQGTTDPETGTVALSMTNAQGTFGPVKIAKVQELNRNGYGTGLIHKPSSETYRFWDLTPEQIEEMNREAMGG